MTRCRNLPATADDRHGPIGSFLRPWVLPFTTCVEENTGLRRKGRLRAFADREPKLLSRLRKEPQVDEEETKMEAHRLRVREATGEWAELREGLLRVILVVATDRGGHLRLGAPRVAHGRLGEQARGRHGPQCGLERDPAREQLLGRPVWLPERGDERRLAG